MGKPRSLTPFPRRSRQRDDGPRADPNSGENDIQQFDPYDTRHLQQSTNTNSSRANNTIIGTEKTSSRLPLQREAIPPGQNAKRSDAKSTRRKNSFDNNRTRRVPADGGRPEVSPDSSYRHTDGFDSRHDLNRPRSLDRLDYQDEYAVQADDRYAGRSESNIGHHRSRSSSIGTYRSSSSDTYGRPQSLTGSRPDDEYAGRSESNIGCRRQSNSSNVDHIRRTSRDRGRRPNDRHGGRSESTQRGRGSDREESRRRSSSSRLRRDRKRKEDSRQFSTKRLSKDHVTMIYTEDEPRIEISNTEIKRGMYGQQAAI